MDIFSSSRNVSIFEKRFSNILAAMVVIHAWQEGQVVGGCITTVAVVRRVAVIVFPRAAICI